MDSKIAGKLLAIIEEDREDFQDLVAAAYTKFVEPLPLPASLDAVLRNIAADATGMGYDKVVAFLKEQAGIAGDDNAIPTPSA